MMETLRERNKLLLGLVQSKVGTIIAEAYLDLGDVVVRVVRERVLDFLRLLKVDAEFSFDMLVDIASVDWLDTRPERFELVYNLLSTRKLHRIQVKVAVPEAEPEVDSVTDLWASAFFLEREVWDMLGVRFRNHPDLRRILNYEEFKGHPIRKDYPVQGKQPRVPMRHPEARNTSMDMIRPALVQLKRKAGAEDSDTREAR